MVVKAEGTILKLTVTDLEAVDALMKRNSRTLGFLTREALEGYLRMGDVFGLKSCSGKLMGYLLYATHRTYFRITHLCVSEEFRGRGLARRFIEHLKEATTTQKTVRLACRNDFPAHRMWPKLGFVSIGEKRGKSKEGYLLTIWQLVLAHDDQLELFRAKVSDTVLDVAMDAQIFFDFDEPDSEDSQASKVLLTDSFVDSVNLGYTDELFNEISRNPDADKRREDRDRTVHFFPVKHNPLIADVLAESLKQILPSGNQSQLSDINHLAKTAASDVSVFVTRDGRLLKKAALIADLVDVQVLSPTELVLQLNELADKDNYHPDRVSGLVLEWRRLTSHELTEFPFERFLERGEPLRRLKRKFEALLVDSTPNEIEVLWSEGEPIAIRGVRYDSDQTLSLTIGRLSRSADGTHVGQFLVSDLIYKAIRQNRSMLNFETHSVPTSVIHGLSDMGFRRSGDHFVRFCLPHCQNRTATLVEIEELAPETMDDYQDMTLLDLERFCSPLSTDQQQNYFLIPIKPRYALHLFDRRQSAQDMFGGNSNVLMLWRNVYYRKATLRRMLRVPGRILWYVSRNPKAIVAVSHLDKVEINTPKELFRQFKKIGTLKSEDLYEMCGREPLRELMAIQFSHTFLFEKPIALDAVRKAFEEEDVGFSVQSPRRLQPSTFRKLFELGYPERS